MGCQIKGLTGNSAITVKEREYILSLIKDNDDVLEIGTLDGVTVAHWAKQRPKAKFLSVDPFRKAMGTGSGNITRWNDNKQPNQCLLVGVVRDLIPFGVRSCFDLIFVDGDHSEKGCLDDLNFACTLLRPTCPIIVHDYGRTNLKHLAGVTHAVDKFADASGFGVESIPDTVLAVLRLNQ